ncbi:uncharacterized protein PV09_06241 [Verruconis gallopava]|uniref:DH domain-containing protein n=1 Tax=Verruconis gallopava TaxID=253628 RepID=A0A0D2A794_9PEZI|nr:uncharacterized protein PV09_06241 [Verruconis gallopava]KIW02425.1 hypothetical protein PV09_06241 [Verruconis gallopava]
MDVAVRTPSAALHQPPRALPSSTPNRLNTLARPSAPMPSQSSAHFSSSSQQSSLRNSNSTDATSSSTLFGHVPPMPTSTPSNGVGPVVASNNVLNKRGDESQSLFQICVNTRQRLRAIPECEEALQQEEEDAQEHNEDADPVTLLWRTLRQGFPLMALYNAFNPEQPLTVDPNKLTKRDRAASMKFLTACIRELNFPMTEMFTVSELYGEDTTGFVKVVRVVNRVLDMLVQQGCIPDTSEAAASADDAAATAAQAVKKAKTRRQHIVDELVSTERTYVQHLEMLQAFKELVETRQIVSGDTIHDIFLNLNALLDFQRRFLIRVEQTYALPEEQQNWGALFTLYRDAFTVYEPYIANTRKCEQVALREFDKLKETGGPPELRSMVESPTVFSAFLLKPFQRLSKYPLLLRELRDKGDLSDEKREDITRGIEAASAVLDRTNEAVHMEERNAATQELRERVEDWKGHRLDSFGELLQYGTYQVIKGGSSSGKDEEREYKIYLFQMILLCCKEMNTKKEKNKNKQATDRKGRTKLQLKGRIFMQNVTDTICQSKPGYYACQIFWKGDPGIEFFTIKFPTEETMRKWASIVDTQRLMWAESQMTPRSSTLSRSTTQVSDREFNWIREQNLENPYAEQDDDDDDADATTLVNSVYGSGSVAGGSSSSLGTRSRTNTLDSAMGRVPPRQFPMGNQTPALQVRTNPAMLQNMTTHSPGPDVMESYFSPTSESPVSTRSSGQLSMHSGMYPFPRQPVPAMPNGYEDSNNRFTAPAMPRQASRDGSLNGYQARGAQRPSLPPSMNSAQNARMRSASSPDIQNPIGVRRLPDPSQPGVPDMPAFPAHYAYQPGIGRQNSGSPASMASMHQGLPMRPNTQSPSVQQQRERMATSQRSGGSQDYPYVANAQQPVPPHLTRGMSQVDRIGTPGSIDARMMERQQQRTHTPPMPVQGLPATPHPQPTQLKVKVAYAAGSFTTTLVVPITISYQTLKDRIDAKLSRTSNVSLASGQVKLKYLDDGDYISIQNDEDVQVAFEIWREQIGSGQPMAEVQLFVQ